MVSAESWIIVPIIVPLTAALLSFLVRRGSFLISLTAAGINILAAAVLISRFLSYGPAAYALGGWDPPLGICLRTDGPALIMLVITALAGVGISLYGWGYFSLRIARPARVGRPEKQERFFWPLWMIQLTGLNALYLSGDIFNLYVALELVGISAAALASLSGKPASLIASLRYLLVSLFGSMSYLLGVVFLYKTYGVLDLGLLQKMASPEPGVIAALSVMTVGLLLKTAVFPLHFWLPPAHANALAPVSGILSGLAIKGSFFLLFRLWFDIFSPALPGPAYNLIGLLGAGAVLWGGIQALRQKRLKLLIAYSTVSQIGYLFIAFPLALDGGSSQAWSAVLFLASGHACAKIAMFMAAGTILLHIGHDRINELAGIRTSLPVASFAYAVAGVNLIGLPPSGGFIAKWMMLITSISTHQWLWTLILMSGSFLAAGYVFKVVSQLFVAPPAAAKIIKHPRAVLLEWPALILALISLLMGLFAPWPLRLLEIGIMSPAVLAIGGGP
ncbi:MAG: proton-conducting transporter membrane subunit [Desulfobulbaceae bacterium]|nr:proton-conducting transporter membrane subunit [Desulfobulbaceae bacterium]